MPAMNRPHSAANKPRSVISGDKMYGLTRRLIVKNNAYGYSTRRFQGATDKDWMKPAVQKVIANVVERKVFGNSFDSRAATRSLIDEIDSALEPGKPQAKMKKDAKKVLMTYLVGRWNAEAKHGKDVDAISSVRALRLVFEQISEKSHSMIEEVRAMDTDNYAERGSKRPKDMRMKKYYASNAKDSFAQMLMHYSSIRHIADFAAEVLKEMERGEM